MSGGEWLIRQERPPNEYGGRLIERITVEDAPTASGTEPDVGQYDHGLVFTYADGRILIFPWANIVSAEYRPHPEP